MRIGGIRRVVTSVLLCVFVLGMFIVFPQANGLDVPMYYIHSLEEYETELAKYALPGDYVTYDMIKSVGQFVMMHLGTSKTLTADHIYFVLRDKTGVKISFSANYPTEYNSIKDRIITDCVTDIHDLRQTQSIGEQYWYYKNGDIFYEYNEEGNLLDIRWNYKARVYSVSLYGVRQDLRNYSMTEDTFVSRLLDADTAQAAVDELMASIDAGQAPLRRQEFWRDVKDWAIAILIMAAIVGGMIAIWKLRERKRLLEEIEEEEFKAAYKDA